MNFKYLHLSDSENILSDTLPGKKAKRILGEQAIYESNNRIYPQILPLVPDISKGSIIQDVDGNQFIDFFSGAGVLNLGHNNEYILNGIKEQQEKYIHGLDYPTKIKIDFMRMFNENFPSNMKDKFKFAFCSPSGSDSVEAAIKLARIITKKKNILSFQGAFHGMTQTSLDATFNNYHKKDLPKLKSYVKFLPYSYCYRCPMNRDKDNCKEECASFVIDKITKQSKSKEKPAAVIIEAIQGEGGVVPINKKFVKDIAITCHDLGILLIVDEIQSGFYRTGKLFSFQEHDILPDFVTMSKGIGGIGMPIAILLLKNEHDVWEKGTHTGTFRGNQLSIMAGTKAIEFVKKNNIELYVSDLGQLFMEELGAIMERSRFIGDIRGKGLMIGIECVKNKVTKEPYKEFADRLLQECFKRGLILEIGGIYNNVIRVMPPLVTTHELALRGIKILEKSIQFLEKE